MWNGLERPCKQPGRIWRLTARYREQPLPRRTQRCFNPHPARRPGATAATTQRRRQQRLVSILTRPEGQVPPSSISPSQASSPMFQSSPGPKARCHYHRTDRCVNREQVSILTRPEGQVPRGRLWHALRREHAVSILTRPEGQVPPLTCSGPLTLSDRFQSSPGPKARCHVSIDGASTTYSNLVSILTRHEGQVPLCCTPSLARYSWFQSSPGPKARCHLSGRRRAGSRSKFQSSPGPKARCHRTGCRRSHRQSQSFNPHPARRPGATSKVAKSWTSA